MKIEITNLKKYNDLESIHLPSKVLKKAVFFHGNEKLDNRCDAITSFFNEKIQYSYKIIYHENKFSFSVYHNGEESNIRSVLFGKEFIEKLSNKVFVLDTTSLGFAEILLLLHYLSQKKNISIKLFYVEPDEYKLNGKKSMFKNEFDLSEGFNNFRKIPPYSILIDSSSSHKAKLITLLGFENDRLSRILEDDDGARYDTFEHIIALPAFKPGWENISLHRHSHELKGTRNLEFAPANNPYETNKVLENIKKNSKDKNLVIAPIGTKPHAIGAIIFLINSKLNEEKIGVMYDFPIKKEKRTDGVGFIHEYIVRINN